MTRSLLLKLRRRLMAQVFAEAAAWVALPVALGAAGLAAFGPRLSAVQTGALAGAAAVLVALVAALWTLWRRPSLREVAARLDHDAATRDRFATALAFGSGQAGEQENGRGNPGAATPLQRAAVAECEAFLAHFDGRRWTPWRMPRALPWFCVPLLAAALFQLPGRFASPEAAHREADPRALKTAARLEEIATRLEEKRENPETMKKVAEALKKGAEHLRAEAHGAAPEKAVLRELSEMEETLKSAQAGHEMAVLADALEAMKPSPTAEEAAGALRQGDAGAAARKLEELARQLAEKSGTAGEQERLARMEKGMQRAARELGERSALGAAAAKAAAAGQRHDAKGAGEAMNELGEALRASRSARSGGEGQPSETSRELEALIAAMREMKSGQSEKPGQEGESAPGNGRRMFAMSPSGKEGRGDPMAGLGESASGQPGSEHDQGTKKSPYGAEGAPPAAPEMQTQIQGLLGEGESLRTLLPSQPGEEPAKTGYKALYEAAAPAAEDALEKENIPLGSRLFVKRYFESIRPKP